MTALIATAFYFILPVLLAAVLHVLVIKLGWLGPLAKPVHAGSFGINKTWRGFVVMPIAGVVAMAAVLPLERGAPAVLLVHFATRPWVALGALLGLAYVLFELPNSFLKRRAGIPPGGQATRHRWLFFALDHLDSLSGCVLVYALFLGALPPALLLAAGLGPSIHVAVNLMLRACHLRAAWF